MKRLILAMILGFCISPAYSQLPSSCANAVECPEHHARSTFTGKIQHSGQCLYGEYSHPYVDADRRLQEHVFWAACGCQGY